MRARNTRMSFRSIYTLGVACLLVACTHAPATTAAIKALPRMQRVQMQTSAGDLVIEVDPVHAPITANNFLALVDLHALDGGSFYRVVRHDNDTQPLKISVVQGGIGDLRRDQSLSPLPAPIAHETTQQTGLKHVDGAISMARGKVGTASSEFFISVGENPVLDFGGQRNPDGQGFAVFGRVVQGMDVVRRIQTMPSDTATGDAYVKGQILSQPVRILHVSRIP